MTAGKGAAVRFDHVSFSVHTGRAQLDVVRDCSFQLEPGEIVAMIGPSGGGKSTIGYLLAGYSRATSGSVTVDGWEVKGPSAQRLLLFQENALMPWLTTAENVMFGPRARGTKRAEARRAADDILARIGLKDFADRYPGELSGGMRRRAELARALVNEPSVLILDEPFRGLDAMTRKLMQEYTAELLTEQGRTALFITTDVDEALLFADRLLVMSDRPATVVDEFAITLKRPRHRADVLSDDRVQEIKDRALGRLICPTQ
ncbi:ABC transporter ATP-binding protein [Mycobacterium sp. EPa45]|uniref:ABC transporter ATP-binding protein n=1 Tax=Mycobacterium sp. EPa45 TaxID=1545728 RepID=UPI000641C20A|nr:ABC transporter ATP-binding protein [Mycobacterium sp. EPa45]AKK26567.1 ABC transporter [Mycobacterium sp. EPa45]